MCSSDLVLREWGLAVVFRDLNGDGFPDLYVSNDFASPDRLWFNDGRGHFRAAPSQALRHTCFNSMGIDVTDVDRANDSHEGAEHFRAIFESSKLAILLVDLHGLVMEANPAFRRAFGYGGKDLRGRPIEELVVPEERTSDRKSTRLNSSH